jgi:hypothetical protein
MPSRRVITSLSPAHVLAVLYVAGSAAGQHCRPVRHGQAPGCPGAVVRLADAGAWPPGRAHVVRGAGRESEELGGVPAPGHAGGREGREIKI